MSIWFRLVLVLLFCGVAVPSMAGEQRQPVALFDLGHGERFVPQRSNELDLSKLFAVFVEQGYRVNSAAEPFTPALLEKVDVLVLSGPFTPLTPAEASALKHFVEQGGRLIVTLHIAPPVSGLLAQFAVVHANGVVREEGASIDGEPLNFRVTRLEQHPLFTGMSGFSLYGGWPLICDGPPLQVIASSGEHSWVDLNNNRQRDTGDAMQSFGVVAAGDVGRGKVAIFGDDAIFQNRFLVGDNLLLANNLARWVKP